MISITGRYGSIPTFVSKPQGEGPWSAMVVVHDGLGMSEDLRNQTRWLAESGYMAAAPDLFHRGGRMRCLFRMMRDMAKGTKGPAFDDLATVQTWLARHEQCTGTVGIIGFCLGGGFAIMLAPGHGYTASVVNYGAVSDEYWDKMAEACPIVASYGADDPTLKGMADKLEHELSRRNIPHDVKEYQGVGHGFMNNHDAKDSNWILGLLSRVSNTRYDATATEDARRRIIAFLNAHLKT